jgi:hypothetical protein
MASTVTLTVNGRPIAYRYMAVTALPGDSIELRLEGEQQTGFTLEFSRGVASSTPKTWTWIAPSEPGIYPLRVRRAAGHDFVHLNVLVMHPQSAVIDGALNGYAIGAYRSTPLRGNPVYLPPTGFVEVDPGDHDVLVSPHFTLGQFICKQPGTPRYLALSLPLLVKLEAVLEAANASGYATPSLHVMSGFRTPAYNAAIGNKTSYSRHLWGDAADVFIDADADGFMDDLNGDGTSNRADAEVLARIVNEVENRRLAGISDGGVGVYRANAVHGPFVHIDARGHRARW